MPKYNYIAKDINGIVHKGAMEVLDKTALRIRLKRDALFLISIKLEREWRLPLLPFFNKINDKEITELAEQFAIMIESGLPLVQCLSIIIEQCDNQRLREVMKEVKQDVENGSSLANALGKHPKVFSKIFTSLIKSGEIVGTLPKTLRQIADNLAKEQENKQKLKSALAYPKIVMSICLLVIIFVLSFVIPRFTKIYESLNLDLPAITLIFVGVSKLILKYWWSFPIVIALIILMSNMLKRSESRIIDNIKLKIPILGELYRKSTISRFIYVLGSLCGGGVPLLQSLEVAQEVMDNKVISDVIDTARGSVKAGGRIKDALSNSKLFPTLVVQMVAIGEETGNLPFALDKSAHYLEREVDAVMKRLITKVEPMLTVVLGVIVALMAAAIYMPLFDIVKMAR